MVVKHFGCCVLTELCPGVRSFAAFDGPPFRRFAKPRAGTAINYGLNRFPQTANSPQIAADAGRPNSERQPQHLKPSGRFFFRIRWPRPSKRRRRRKLARDGTSDHAPTVLAAIREIPFRAPPHRPRPPPRVFVKLNLAAIRLPRPGPPRSPRIGCRAVECGGLENLFRSFGPPSVPELSSLRPPPFALAGFLAPWRGLLLGSQPVELCGRTERSN